MTEAMEMSHIWGRLKEPTAIDLRSSVDGKTITKPEIRKQVWDFLEENDLVNLPKPPHKRIPNFKGAAHAGQKVPSLTEFQKANTIKVNPDKPQEEVRYQVLDHNKILLVPTPRLKTGLFNHIENPGGNTSKEYLRTLASRQGIDNHSKPLSQSSKIKIDAVVLGAVAVDKLGHRIGKGEGFADLEYAIGLHFGNITPETIVISTVHDCQVFDSLPDEIFGDHDVPVDIIVTPTMIHRVEKPLPKPTGINWDILSAEKINKMPILKKLKLGEGVDSARDSKPKTERRNYVEDLTNTREKVQREKVDEKTTKDEEKTRREEEEIAKSEEEEPVKGEEEKKKRARRNNRNRNRNRRKGNKKENDEEAYEQQDKKVEEKIEKNKKYDVEKKKQSSVRNDEESGEKEVVYDDRPMLYIGKIPRTARVTDLKSVLHERGIKARELIWKGWKGYAFLFFDESQDVEELFSTLSDLQIGDDVLDVQREKFKDRYN